VQIKIDTMKDSHEDIRNAVAFLLHLIGDLNDDPNELAAHTHNDTVASGPTAAPSAAAQGAAITSTTIPTPPTGIPAAYRDSFIPPPPIPPMITRISAAMTPSSSLVPADSNGEFTEEQISNVLPFPVPPPPPPPPPPTADTAATTIPAPPALSAGAATTVASVDGPSGVDSAGMTYDKRIHQKTGNKKKDGTWKLIKGIDPAVVAAVTAELAASKGASAPVSLPAGQGSVPVPPIPPAVSTAATGVPTPPAPPVVPVPPVAAVGAVSPYRAFIERITTATKEGKITPARVNELCQANGVPNLMQLNNMPDKIDIVGTMIDAAIAGLA
jgi:hypothetical protein